MSEIQNKKDGRSCEATAQTTTPSEKKEVDMFNINPTCNPQLTQAEVIAECGYFHDTTARDLSCLTKAKGSDGFRVNNDLATLSVREYARYHGVSREAINEQVIRREIPHMVLGGQVFLLVRRFRCHLCEPQELNWPLTSPKDE
jgi:hypothetical protein